MKTFLLAVFIWFLFQGQALAAGLATPAAEIEDFQFYTTSNAAYIKLDSSVSVSNPNSCTTHANWFEISDITADRTKVVIGLLQMAYAMKKKISIYSSGCGINNAYNLLTRIQLVD